MTRKMTWSLLGGLLLIGLAGIVISRRAGQPPISETAAAVVEPTAAPTETAAHEEIATYRNEEFGFSVQYPKIVPCRFGSDGDTCKLNMSPRDLSSIGVRDSVVFFLEAIDLSFYITIEKKLPDFTDLHTLVQYRSDHINDEVSDPPITSTSISQITWHGYTAVIDNYLYQGNEQCEIYIEKDVYIYEISYPYPCHMNISSIDKYDAAEQKRIAAIRIILNQFTFDKGGE